MIFKFFKLKKKQNGKMMFSLAWNTMFMITKQFLF